MRISRKVRIFDQKNATNALTEEDQEYVFDERQEPGKKTV